MANPLIDPNGNGIPDATEAETHRQTMEVTLQSLKEGIKKAHDEKNPPEARPDVLPNPQQPAPAGPSSTSS